MRNLAPATWTVADVTAWATESKVPPEVISSLTLNQVDGPTIITLTKSDLKSELGIASLPARRYPWELITSLKAEQATSDYSVAIQVHEEEIKVLATTVVGQGADAASGGAKGKAFDSKENADVIVKELVSEAGKQRQVIEDHMMAFQLQKALNMGHEVCRDAQVAHEEQDRLDQLRDQEESDRAYAESLATGTERRAVATRRRQQEAATQQAVGTTTDGIQSDSEKRVASLFGLCVQTCADNKINVAEAFRTGKVKPMPQLSSKTAASALTLM